MPADITHRDRAVASHLTAYLSVALANKAVRRVVTWGLSTRYSWLNATPGIRRSDGAETRGLPFDQNLDRSAMGDALIRCFAARRRQRGRP
jgi:endo-1,4-beta-xylanase